MIPAAARVLYRHVRRWRWAVAALALSASYPACVLASVYVSTAQSGLPGGRHGPRDAYRHSLASATVAYTLSPRCVTWVTAVMEDGGRGDASRAMDAHNNRVGARIGARADSWRAMRDTVRAAVDAGQMLEDAAGDEARRASDSAASAHAPDPDRIVWRAPRHWRERAY